MTDINTKKIISTQEELEYYLKKEREIRPISIHEEIKNVEFNFSKDNPGIIDNTLFCHDNMLGLIHLSFEDCIFNNVLFINLTINNLECLLFKNCSIFGKFLNCDISSVLGFSNCKLKREKLSLNTSKTDYNFIKNCNTKELILEDCEYIDTIIMSKNNISRLMVYDSKGYFKNSNKEVASSLIRLHNNNISSLYLKREEALSIYKNIRSRSSDTFKDIVVEEAGGELRRYSVIKNNINYYIKKKIDVQHYELSRFDYYMNDQRYYYYNDISYSFSICYDELTNTIALDGIKYSYLDFKNDLINKPDNLVNIVRDVVIENILYNKGDKAFLKLKKEYNELNDSYDYGYYDEDDYSEEIEDNYSYNRSILISKIEEYLKDHKYKYFNNYIKPKLLLFCSYIDRINSINSSIEE